MVNTVVQAVLQPEQDQTRTSHHKIWYCFHSGAVGILPLSRTSEAHTNMIQSDHSFLSVVKKTCSPTWQRGSNARANDWLRDWNCAGYVDGSIKFRSRQ